MSEPFKEVQMPEKSKPGIEPREDGPYVATEIPKVRTSRGEQVKGSKTMVLCRCGLSAAKPFCDGAHVKSGFKSAKLEGRQPDRVDDYAGLRITIHDNRGVCSHAGHCTDNLPKVFRMRTEPWIDPDGVAVEEIIRVIRMCPSGALSYTLEDERHTEFEKHPSLQLAEDGPISVKGGSKKSGTAVPSRRNSGLAATPNSTPGSRDDLSASIGATTSSTVPGRTVLLTTIP